jgi:predicted nucleic acid-binding protein
MTLVSNTSPLCYLALIGHAEILPKLYGNIHTTQKVLEELRHPDAPPAVRNWATTPPDWLKIHSDPEEPDQTLAALAVQRGLKVSGTLGVLCDAAQAGLLKLPAALDLLRKTNFRASRELWKSLYTR